jgi:hypothetical protein
MVFVEVDNRSDISHHSFLDRNVHLSREIPCFQQPRVAASKVGLARGYPPNVANAT